MLVSNLFDLRQSGLFQAIILLSENIHLPDLVRNFPTCVAASLKSVFFELPHWAVNDVAYGLIQKNRCADHARVTVKVGAASYPLPISGVAPLTGLRKFWGCTVRASQY